jgi:hypothetical protein
MYGGLIMAGFMVIRYFKKNGIPCVARYGHSAAPGVMLAYGIGRIGCQVSGDGDWGIVNNATAPGWMPKWLWSYSYPNNVNSVGIPFTGEPCFPGYCTVLPEPYSPPRSTNTDVRGPLLRALGLAKTHHHGWHHLLRSSCCSMASSGSSSKRSA